MASWKEKVASHWETMGKLKQYLGLLAARHIKRRADSNHKNMDAEEKYVREQMWGATEKDSGDEVSDQTVLGDIFSVKTGSGVGSLAKTLLAVGLGTSIPTAGGIYLADKYLPELLGRAKPETSEVEQTDEPDIEFGLGKLEDYFPNGIPIEGQ